MNINEWKDFMDKEIMLSGDAREFLEMSNSAFGQALSSKRLEPIYERGKKRGGIVRFFLRSDVEEYKKQVIERRKRLK
ncbi:MAG TPA: hypothetical protein VLA13_00830 [Massilibacterium sp.]|nr:hypothetical protein [Massilibacterium sp.]